MPVLDPKRLNQRVAELISKYTKIVENDLSVRRRSVYEPIIKDLQKVLSGTKPFGILHSELADIRMFEHNKTKRAAQDHIYEDFKAVWVECCADDQ